MFSDSFDDKEVYVSSYDHFDGNGIIRGLRANINGIYNDGGCGGFIYTLDKGIYKNGYTIDDGCIYYDEDFICTFSVDVPKKKNKLLIKI